MDTGMYFEMTMRLLFGDRMAYHIADSEMAPGRRRAWLQRTVRKFIRFVDAIDTTPSHKQRMMTDLAAIETSLKGTQEPSWELVYSLLRLCMHFLGFESASGVTCHTPTYWRTPAQYRYTRPRSADGPFMQSINDQQDAISVRRTIIEDLRRQGLDDFKIAVVLNTSEYAVKQLRSNLTLQRPGAHVTRSPGR